MRQLLSPKLRSSFNRVHGCLKRCKIPATVNSMPNEEDHMSLDIWCDLLERELKMALENLEKIRKSDKAQAKNTCYMLRAALGNARHYLTEIQDSLTN